MRPVKVERCAAVVQNGLNLLFCNEMTSTKIMITKLLVDSTSEYLRSSLQLCGEPEYS